MAGRTLHLPRDSALPLLDIEAVGMPDSVACLGIVTYESTAVTQEFVGMYVLVSVHLVVVPQTS